MLNTSDYLIPLKFFSLIIQTIFSISALITRVNQYFINKFNIGNKKMYFMKTNILIKKI